MKAQTLLVPGATLYYETRGSGPVLLMIAGGSTDVGVFESVADILADTYTVVTCDPRGNSRSPLDGPPVDVSIEDLSDDARRLLETVADGPAYVFGSSSGAVTGLDLISKHPALVSRLVAHEPPMFQILPDAADFRAFFDDLYETYRREGAWSAGAKFGKAMGFMRGGDLPPNRELPPEVVAGMQRMNANADFFFAHEAKRFTRYVPDLAALDANKDRIVLAGGEDSRQAPPYRPAAWLAERFGKAVIDFPGDHTGYLTQPVAFAAKLREVLK